MNSLYLLVDLGAIMVPLIFSFHPRIVLYKKWPFLWPGIILSTLPFILWDSYFTQKGVWGFTSDYILGHSFFHLPFEEILFFICIPYACMFTYYCFRVLLPAPFKLRHENVVTAIILAIAVGLGVTFHDRLYTLFTAVGLTVFLIFLKLSKVRWLSLFYYSHMFLLIPFLIVNGILTGTGPDKPVVWYNNLENMGLRLVTIPFEDIFYGMLMLLLNTYFFELFLEKFDRVAKNSEPVAVG